MDSIEPPSIGGSREDVEVESSALDPALLRLHSSLKSLDTAIYDALRALDVALGREPTTGPDEVLPFRELGRLKLHLEAATREPEKERGRSLDDMALDWADENPAPEE
jgi:hypothetical protein